MKKIKIIIVIVCLFLGTFAFKVFYKNTIKAKRTPYQVYVNGVEQSTMPSKGSFNVIVVCTRSEAYWDYDSWKLVVESSNRGTNECYLEFNSIANEDKKYISSYIKDELLGVKQGYSLNDGQIIHETFVNNNTTYDTGYRYEGSNPNNYVMFNGELWRIIGTFSVTSTGESNPKYLTKIIRNESIGSYAYDNSSSSGYQPYSGSSIWLTQNGTRKASLNYLLNDYYYLSLDGTNSGYCLFANYVPSQSNSRNVTRNCDYSVIGINTTYRSMIEEVTWNLGGTGYSNNPRAAYMAERGTSKPSGSANTWDGYIGLMYPSDYAFSVLATSCDRTTKISAYNTNACGGHAWLLKYGFEWTLSPYGTDTKGVINIGYTAAIGKYEAAAAFAVRPVLYLKSNVYIVDGDGSLTDPYILMM